MLYLRILDKNGQLKMLAKPVLSLLGYETEIKILINKHDYSKK